MLHTSVILLFLVVVAQFSLTLGGHAALGLRHLLGFGLAALVALVGVEALHMAGGTGAGWVEFH
jgi:hypothetical protein